MAVSHLSLLVARRCHSCLGQGISLLSALIHDEWLPRFVCGSLFTEGVDFRSERQADTRPKPNPSDAWRDKAAVPDRCRADPTMVDEVVGEKQSSGTKIGAELIQRWLKAARMAASCSEPSPCCHGREKENKSQPCGNQFAWESDVSAIS